MFRRFVLWPIYQLTTRTMTSKAYIKGSQYPPLKEGTKRIYCMRFCPYCQRVKLVMNFLNLPYEVVNINLENKPEWFLEKNPGGTIPVLEHDGRIVTDSAVCCEYLEDMYGKHELIPSDPYEKAKMKIFMESFGKVTSKYHALLRPESENAKKSDMEELRKLLLNVENKLCEPFAMGKKFTMLDIHMWPWFERFPMLENVTGLSVVTNESYPKLSAWVNLMKQQPAVNSTILDTQLHVDYIKPFTLRQPLNFDIGLSGDS